jgi:hypothetical protein
MALPPMSLPEAKPRAKVGRFSRGTCESSPITGFQAAAKGMSSIMAEARPDIRGIRGKSDFEALQYPCKFQTHSYQKLNYCYWGKPLQTHSYHLVNPEPREQRSNTGQNEDDE